MDCRFTKNTYLYTILIQRLEKQLEELNRRADGPYKTYNYFPFEISEIEMHEVKISSNLIRSKSSEYYLVTNVTFPKDTELDEILDTLSKENSENKFEISESKLISCDNEILNSRNLLTSSIINRVPKFLKYQSDDRIFNVIPYKGLPQHCYSCIEQKREEKIEYVYFDTTACVVKSELRIFTIKTNNFQEIPQEEEVDEDGSCNAIFKNLYQFYIVIKNQFKKHIKLD